MKIIKPLNKFNDILMGVEFDRLYNISKVYGITFSGLIIIMVHKTLVGNLWYDLTQYLAREPYFLLFQLQIYIYLKVLLKEIKNNYKILISMI